MYSEEIGKYIKNIFKNNLEEDFIYDSINDRKFTYRDFFKKILSFKRRLIELGFKKNDTICLVMNNSVELATLYFSILISDMIAAPIDPIKGEKEILQILSEMKYKGVITNIDELNSLPKAINIKELEKNEDIEFNEKELDIFEKLDYNKLYLITFTSGSTGTPKGVMNSFKNLFLTSLAFRERFNFNKTNIWYHNLPMTYMAGILNLFLKPFLSESKVIISERFNIANLANFWQKPIKYKANTFWLIPTIVNLLLKIDRGNEGVEYGKNNKVIACVGTAPLNHEARMQFEKKYNILLYESYGLSETLFVATNYPNGGTRDRTVGKPLIGVKLKFMEDGEIVVKVPWTFLGYTNADTSKYFYKGGYLSGDIGEINKEGFLKITGRKKDIISKGGIKINPKRIEDLISSIGIFEESVILGFEDKVIGERVVCFYVHKNVTDMKEELKKLNHKIGDQLGKHYIIDEFIQLKEIPRNINGKIDKLTIRKNYLSQNDNKN